jgi:transaldolase
LQEEYPVELAPGVDAAKVRVEDFWQISDDVYRLAERLDDDPPADGSALAERARAAGCRDMFPEFTEEDRRRIASDGKIPSYQYWKDRIASGEVAVDTLMNQAGLAAFTADQKALDDRVRGLIQ